MKVMLLSFIGIAINIWTDTTGEGGSVVPAKALVDRFNVPIVDRFGNFILTR